jgi:hypothetical protein
MAAAAQALYSDGARTRTRALARRTTIPLLAPMEAVRLLAIDVQCLQEGWCNDRATFSTDRTIAKATAAGQTHSSSPLNTASSGSL